MKSYTLPLSAPQADLETVGGKGMSLAKLANAGLPVPGGFHVATEAYRQFVSANDLQDGINEALNAVDTSQPSTLEIASASIGGLFAQADIPGELANAIVNAYAELPGSNRAASSMPRRISLWRASTGRSLWPRSFSSARPTG